MESIPGDSSIRSYINGAYYADSFSSVMSYENQSALDIFLVIAQKTPRWINNLMFLRNKVVSKLGLKDIGHFADIDFSKPSKDFMVGDRVGIFTLYANTHNEVILEDKDKHLDVKVSFYIEPSDGTARVYASTVVHVKNTLGKVYMFFVAPAHKIIVPSTLKTLPRV